MKEFPFPYTPQEKAQGYDGEPAEKKDLRVTRGATDESGFAPEDPDEAGCIGPRKRIYRTASRCDQAVVQSTAKRR